MKAWIKSILIGTVVGMTFGSLIGGACHSLMHWLIRGNIATQGYFESAGTIYDCKAREKK